MRVRLLTDRAGAYSFQPAGDVVDLPRAEAQALIRAGQAEHAGPENASKNPGAETAAKPPSEPR